MENFTDSFLFTSTTPFFVLIIIVEIIISRIHDKNIYSVKGVVNNIYLMLLNTGLDIILRGFALFVLGYFFTYSVIKIENPILYWITLLFAQDLLFYLLHLVDHYCRFFWAVHVTHHSSEEFNLSVGFRSSVFQPLYRFIYFIPLALFGFKPLDIFFMYSATQLYGILLHTQAIGKLGILEYILVTPSHHRVHHGSNPDYLDKNMGMLFIIWDRMFGTFQEEKETDPVCYGLTTNIQKHDPINLVFHEWKSIMNDVKTSTDLTVKLKYIFYRPGWSHDGTKMTSQQLRKIKSSEGIQDSNFSNFNSRPSKTA